MNKINTLKKSIILNILVFYCLIGFSQVNRYSIPAEQPSDLQYYQLPYDDLKNALLERQSQYDNAKLYANKLYDLISETSRKEIDMQLRNELDEIKGDLDVIYDGDMSRSGNELDKIQRRIGSAIDNYNDRIKINNQSADKIETLEKLMREKKFIDAIEYINANLLYQNYINLNYVYGNRAFCYMSLKKYTQAASDFTKLILRTNISSEELHRAYSGRAWAYLYGENYDAGYSDGEQLTKLQPYNGEGYFVMGYALSGKKKYTEAIGKYTESIKMNPGHSMAFNNRGYDKFKAGLDINDAMKDVNKAIELDPDNVSALSSRAEINIKLEKYTAAIIDLNKAIKIEESGLDYYLRGNAKIRLNDKIGACTDWSKAGDLNEMKAYDQISKFCK